MSGSGGQACPRFRLRHWRAFRACRHPQAHADANASSTSPTTRPFPYGNWKEDELSAHIVRLMGELIATYDPAAVVIACNTASTLVLPPLREKFNIPFVGTVPAVKPAAEQTKSGVIAVLSRPPATIARDYTRKLIESFAQSAKVQLVARAEARERGRRPAARHRHRPARSFAKKSHPALWKLTASVRISSCSDVRIIRSSLRK